jgi:hypothetical protein
MSAGAICRVGELALYYLASEHKDSVLGGQVAEIGLIRSAWPVLFRRHSVMLVN